MISEILGYVGTILVLISFIPKNIKKIRIINIFGCIVWIISAVFSKSYSVMTLNSILMIVHVVHLIKMKNEYKLCINDEKINIIKHNEETEYLIRDENGKICNMLGCRNHNHYCKHCNEGNMYRPMKGE